MTKEKIKKVTYEDDGSTIADMNVEGLPWYQSEKHIKAKKKLMNLNLSPRERRAIVKGAFLAYLPVFLAILLAFVGTYLLILLWMKSKT